MDLHSDELNSLDARIESLESELAGDPSARVFAPLAEAYRLCGQLDRAVETARRGVVEHPGHAGIRVVLARCLMDGGRLEEAGRAYEDALELDPNNAEALEFVSPRPRAVETEPPVETEPAEQAPMEAPPAPDVPPDPEPREATGTLSEELEHLADLFMPAPSRDGGRGERPGREGIATLTLAEIYSRQGLNDKAAEVCELILEKDPQNERARSALESYRNHMASVEGGAA